MMNLTATEYQFNFEVGRKDFTGMQVKFARMESPFYEGVKWSVRWMGRCLNKQGEWDWEPSPSSRDDDFYAKCRFESLEEAYTLALKAPRIVNGYDLNAKPTECSLSSHSVGKMVEVPDKGRI
jgi:hypothetical protein